MRGKKGAHHVGSHPERIAAVSLGILLIVLAGSLFWFQQKVDAPDVAENLEIENTQVAEPEYVSVEGKYMFSGTIVLGRAVERVATNDQGVIDYAQPFGEIDSFNPDQYDAWEADIECPVTRNYLTFDYQIENTIFNCPPEFLPELSKYVTIANIANNHTRDQGDEGFEETIKNLEDGGLQTVGHYDPRQTDDICEVISLPVRLQKSDSTETEAKLPVAFCAWHYFQKDPAPGEIEEMDKYAEIMPVFAFMQVGVEYRPTADFRQVDFAHRIMDRGPEFLIGNSPHWVQNTEAYKGKLIVYSTGNFIFDQLELETNRGLNIAADMKLTYDDNVRKWLAIGDSCGQRADDCLEQGQAHDLEKVDVELSYEAIGSKGGYNVQVQKASDESQKEIEARANWQETMKGLN